MKKERKKSAWKEKSQAYKESDLHWMNTGENHDATVGGRCGAVMRRFGVNVIIARLRKN